MERSLFEIMTSSEVIISNNDLSIVQIITSQVEVFCLGVLIWKEEPSKTMGYTHRYILNATSPLWCHLEKRGHDWQGHGLFDTIFGKYTVALIKDKKEAWLTPA